MLNRILIVFLLLLGIVPFTTAYDNSNKSGRLKIDPQKVYGSLENSPEANSNTKNTDTVPATPKPAKAVPTLPKKTPQAASLARFVEPGDNFVAAYKDALQFRNSQYVTYIRYLSLYNIEPSLRFKIIKVVLNLHINSLSSAPDLQPLYIVPGTQGTLVRLNLADYNIKREVWEKLGEFDPYFHFQIELTELVKEKVIIEENGQKVYDGHWANGQFVYKYNESKKKTVKQAIVPWIADTPNRLTAVQGLVNLLQSKSPILRADWFFRKTAIAQDDTEQNIPGYYDFLNLGKTEEDFQNLLGGVEVVKAALKQKKEIAAAIPRTKEVALNNRLLVRLPTFNGCYWYTFDFKQNTGKKNVLRNNDPNDLKPDASEQFGSLPNGLMAWFLVDGKGNRQNTAPDFIASNKRKTDADARVHSELSCMQCHTRGIYPVDDYIRAHLRIPLTYNSPDYEKIKRFRQLYFSDIQGKVSEDVIKYEIKVKEITGMSAAEASQEYSDFWKRYQSVDFDMNQIELDLAMPTAQIVTKLQNLTVKTQDIDIVISDMITSPQNFKIRSEYWEEIFPIINLNIRGLTPVTAVKQLHLYNIEGVKSHD